MRKARTPFVRPGTPALPVATDVSFFLGGWNRGRGRFLAARSTAICLSDTPALPLFRGQKTGTFCFSLQQDRGVRACSPTSMGERCAAVYRGVLTSCLASLERTVPYRRPRGAWRTVTSTSCPNKDRK